jgi:hypothetical protein
MWNTLAGRRGGLGLAAALLLAYPAAAITQPGTLTGAAQDVDFYRVTCSDDGSGVPASLVTQVLDASPVAAPLVSVQSQKGSLATNATDPVDGDGSASPAAFVNGGAGSYDVFVDKSAAGAESYQLSVQCMTGANGTGVATGTALTPISTGAPAVPALSPGGLLALGAGLGLAGCAALRRRRGAAGALLALLAAAGWPADADAHDQGGSLGIAASATDFYQVTCSQDPEPGSPVPALLFLQVLDTSSAPNPEAPALVAVQGQKGSLAANSTDPVGGDASASPGIMLSGGAGVYDVLVYKTEAGSDAYTLTYHCLTADLADHTPTSISPKQNQ